MNFIKDTLNFLKGFLKGFLEKYHTTSLEILTDREKGYKGFIHFLCTILWTIIISLLVLNYGFYDFTKTYEYVLLVLGVFSVVVVSPLQVILSIVKAIFKI